MKVVTTFHPPSAVLCSLKCKLSCDSDLDHLVVAKLNRIDVFSCRPHGLHPECGLEVWGRILSLKAIPVNDSEHSNLVVMMDHPTPELLFLTYSVSDQTHVPTFVTTKHLSLLEHSLRPAEFLNDIFVNSAGRLAVVSCYTGKLKFIALKDGKYDSDFDVSVPELTILALALLPPFDGIPTLLILHIDHQEHIQLLSRDVLGDSELSLSPSVRLQSTVISASTLPLTESPPILVHVPPSIEDRSFLGGVMLVGGREIMLFGFASTDSRAKQGNKRRRLEKRKSSNDPEDVRKAKEKEAGRESRMREPVATVKWPWGEVTAGCIVGNDPPKYLFGDSFGRLALLSLQISPYPLLILLPLGETSPPTTLTYLTSQIVYLGSHMGDSQLLRIESSPICSHSSSTLPIPMDIEAIPASRLFFPAGNDNGLGGELERKKGYVVDSKGSYITVLQTFKNIAPIVDAVLVDADGTGQPHIVTCSGGRNTGSLNLVRNGADFEELAVVAGISNVKNIWPIRHLFMDKLDQQLLVSTLHRTLLFLLGPGACISRVEEVSKGFVTDQPTLALCNIPRRIRNGSVSSYDDSPLVVQVTPKALILLEFDIALREYGQVGESWTPDKLKISKQYNRTGLVRDIVAASVNPGQFVLALTRRVLVSLNLTEGDKFQVVSSLNLTRTSLDNREISAVSCTPPDSSKYLSMFVAVAFWGSNCVEIFSMPQLKWICQTPALPSLPRCLLFHQSFDPTQVSDNSPDANLLVGLGDGNAVSYVFKNEALVDSKTVSLGDGPVSMTAYDVDGRSAVFASGSRSSIFFWDKNLLHHSPVMLKDVAAVSRLNTEAFPDCLIVATPISLIIGKTRDINKIHIRSIALGLDNPRRVVYDASREVLGVACTRTEPVRVGSPEPSSSFFRIMDAASFNVLSQFNCDSDEEITTAEILSVVVDDNPASFYCLGTLIYKVDEVESTEGRLLVFNTAEDSISRSSNLHLSLVTWASVKGCVYALNSMQGMIAAAVNASVLIYTLDKHESSTGLTLHKVTEWTHNYLVRSLASYDDKLFLGDAISSVSVLELANKKLSMVAKDYGSLWPISIQALDNTSIIGSNVDLNIFTFSLQRRGTFGCDGCYHISDLVTKFLPGTLTPRMSTNVPLEPKQVFFTSSGRIGIVIEMGGELSSHMTALQRNMASIDQGAGGTSHTRFRAPKNHKGLSEISAFGFLDGDFLERFLAHISSPTLEKILKGNNEAERLDMTSIQIQGVLEILQGLH